MNRYTRTIILEIYFLVPIHYIFFRKFIFLKKPQSDFNIFDNSHGSLIIF